MGADAEIFPFDYHRYITTVVPAMLEVIRTGQTKSWLRALAAHPLITIKLDLTHHADLARYCTYLSPTDLSWRGDYAASRLGWHWEERACTSPDCPERASCPFHAINPPRAAGELTHLFDVAVAAASLGASQFLGRNFDIVDYEPLLAHLGVAVDHPLWHLLWLLCRRGFVIGYQFANSDGVHGWLDPAETAALFAHLDALDLPRYEATFGAMPEFREHAASPYPEPAMAFAAHSLSYIRTAASMARRENKGILWGNDVLLMDDYDDLRKTLCPI